MYWDPEEVVEFVRFPIEGAAYELGSPVYFIAQADLSSEQIISDERAVLQDRGFDYAPIRPYNSRKVFDVDSGEVLSIEDEQYVDYNDAILKCINILTEFPFLMVVHGDKSSWKIATRADLNTRVTKEYLYSYFAETARAVSQVIESKYGVDEIQDKYLEVRNGKALEYWEKAVGQNVNLHPVEFMSMADMKEVVASDGQLQDELGLPSKTQSRKAFKLVEKFRNRVMHGYRTVISDSDDVIDLVKSLETASELTINAGGEGPGHDIII